jgi:hypothetical protein
VALLHLVISWHYKYPTAHTCQYQHYKYPTAHTCQYQHYKYPTAHTCHYQHYNWANERLLCSQPECSAYIRSKFYLQSVYILCLLSILYLHSVYILPTWSIFCLFCDSISIYTVYFLSILYAVYIEFLAILCLHFVCIVSIFSLSSIHILCVFCTHSTHILHTFLTEHNTEAPSVQHRTLWRQQLHYHLSMWNVTWVPDGISQISTKSPSTSKYPSNRGTKTCIPAWKKSVSSACSQEQTAWFTLTSAVNP